MNQEIIGTQKILLPRHCDMTKWAVIACDQYTTDKNYWNELQSFIGSAPSTLKLTCPEIYLSSTDLDKRIESIDETMNLYIRENFFKESDGMVLVERTLQNGVKRVGLCMSVDLESYDFRTGSFPIRATEKTIVERLPVRMRIRENAPIELPHILLLADDRQKEIIEPLYEKKDSLELLYDFELNQNGGHLRGFKVENTEALRQKFYKLLDKEQQIQKYGVDAGLLFAVGDGNHSMASAKEHWNLLKQNLTEEQRQNHPARYILVEVVNLYQDSMNFEAIHRVMVGCNAEKFVSELQQKLCGSAKLTLVTEKGNILIDCPNEPAETIRQVQEFLIDYKKENGGCIEYEHSEKQVRKLSAQPDTVGILLPVFDKQDLFKYVVHKGNLPQKAFSIGTEETKKYYVEAKRITL